MALARYLRDVDEELRSVDDDDPRVLDDAALAGRIAAGGADGRAELELCRRFAPRIRLYGLRHLRDEAAAQDLVQEVLLAVLDRLRGGSLRDPGRLASFVLGTCRLMVTNERRGAARRAALLAAFGGATAAAEATAPRLDVDRLDRCLEQLAARARAVVLLTFYAGEPADGIARQLGTTAGNVRVVRHRALERLRACVEAREERA
jgi:RNA polymerase sigma-70 factor (ECF subfamily)